MSLQLFANNASSNLAGNITNVQTTLTLTAGAGILFPNPSGGQYFLATLTDVATGLENEIVKVTAVSGDTFTIVRGQEGTTPRAWNAGDLVANLMTAGTADNFVQQGQQQNNSSTFAIDTGTANAYVLPISPGVPTGSDGVILYFKAAHANTGASTVTVSGGTTYPLLGAAGLALQGGEIIANGLYQIEYDSASNSYLIMASTLGSPQVPDATQSHHATSLEQVQTLIGSGAGQIKGAVSNLLITANGTSATVSVSYDELSVENGSGVYATLRSGSLSINTAGSGANGLDTGTLAASTWYAVYAIYNGSTQAGLISLSGSAPTLPAGYTFSAKLGWIFTDATVNKYPLSRRQVGKRIQNVIATGSNMTSMPNIAGSASSEGNPSTPTWIAKSVSTFVSPDAKVINLVLANRAISSTSGQGAVAPNNSYGAQDDIGATGRVPPLVLTQPVTTSGFNASLQGSFVLESSNIYWAQSGDFWLYVIGWEE